MQSIIRALVLVVGAGFVVGGPACGGSGETIGSLLPDGGDSLGPSTVNCTIGPNFTGCPCSSGDQRSCYTGPLSTQGVAPCTNGVQQCEQVDEKYGYGACVGQVLPTATEACTAEEGGMTPRADSGSDTAPVGVAQADAGISDCKGTATAPRLVAPLSTAHVTHQQPHLRWELSGSDDGVHIEFCKDRACAQILQTLDAAGTSGAPRQNLPAGVVYWRAFGSQGGQVSCNPSYTWELFVGPRSAPVNTSWGSVLDINGDGYADAVVGASGAYTVGTPLNNGETEQATILLGGPQGLSTKPVLTLTGERGFGGSVADAGDVNGDGYADVLIGTGSTATHLYLGGPSGLASSPALTLPYGPNVMGGGGFGYSLAGVGDANGDGYADVAVADFSHDNVYIFEGGVGGLSATPTATFTGASVGLNPGDHFGMTLSGAGDVNGDGYSDLLVGAAPSGNPASLALRRAYLYQGGPSGFGPTPTSMPTVPAVGILGPLVMGGGDVNGDGYCDVMVLGQTADASALPTTFVFQGGSSGIPTNPTTALTLNSTATSWYGAGMAGVDLNGDGYTDEVVGAPWIGEFYIYMGGPSGASTTALPAVSGGSPAYFSGGLSGGDVNGDGFGDLAVSNGADIMVYSGSASGLVVSSPATVATGGGYSGFHPALGSL